MHAPCTSMWFVYCLLLRMSCVFIVIIKCSKTNGGRHTVVGAQALEHLAVMNVCYKIFSSHLSEIIEKFSFHIHVWCIILYVISLVDDNGC